MSSDAARSAAVRTAIRGVGIWVAWTEWAIVLGASTAIMLNTVLFGRFPIVESLRGGASSVLLMLVFGGVTAWWLLYAYLLGSGRHGVRSAAIPAVPLLLGAALPLISIHLSDVANYHFQYWMVNLNQPRSLALLLILLLGTVLLQATYLEKARGVASGLAFGRAVARLREPFILVPLAALGVLQATSYLDFLGGDFLRYWAVADALATGVIYPAMPAHPLSVQGGMTSHIVDLPLFPAMLAASFAAFGHNTAAAYVPIAAPNMVLPPLLYLLFREVVRNRALALSLATFAVLFPPLRFYSLNFTGQDAAFFALLTVSAWMFVRVAKGDRRLGVWLLLGLSGGVTAITRPEGAAYAGIYLVAALLMPVRLSHRVASGVLFLLPVAVFSATMMIVFGRPWPSNWAGALGFQNAAANWQLLSATSLPMFGAALRLSSTDLVVYSGLLLVLALVGSLPLICRPRLLSVLMLPAWLNLLAVSMVDPLVSGVRLWFDFFRHISYPIPFLVLAAGVSAQAALRRILHRAAATAVLVLLNLLVVGGVLWDVHYLSRPSLNFGPGSGNLIDTDRVNLVDVFIHPFELPVLRFKVEGAFNVPVGPSEFIAKYPAQLLEFYRPFDPVRNASGTAYQVGSLYLYLAALVLALLPAGVGRARKPALDEGALRNAGVY